jgi:hypothetical protein
MPKQRKPAAQERKKWPTRPKQPVVFMFQPTEYEVVPSERLSEWESLMRKNVGFPAELVKSMSRAGTPCISFCPAFDD